MSRDNEHIKKGEYKTLLCIPYQLCPKCGGEKQVFEPICSAPVTCNVCNGMGVIPMYVLNNIIN